MGKYKKKLRAEKAKVKLKKKKLPKGQNITDTSFKVKKIITVEQLKKTSENEPVSSWNVPLKDLLIHLGHHNKSSRLNGLNGIKEVITNYPNVLNGPLLKTTIMKILECMSDLESKIRTTAVNLLDVIFSQLEPVQITTFYSLLNIHLSCVMTHRQVAIQKDSLKLADIIIKYASDAIRKNFKIIMTNFIRILSSYKYGAQSEVLLTKGSKKDLEENRIAIFQRLCKILSVCYPNEIEVNERNLVINAKEEKCLSKRLFTRHLRKAPDLSEIFIVQSKVFNKEAFDDEEENFKLLVSQIMPLLFDTWAEFCPRNDGRIFEECVIKESTAKLLGVILDIIMLLYQKSLKMEKDDVKNLFSSNYASQLIKSFLSSFPYVPSVMDCNVNNFQDITTAAFSKSYQCQNLIICYLAYHMRLKITNQARNVLDKYVLCALQMRNTKYEDILGRIVETVVFQRKNKLFLESTVRAYKSTSNANFQSTLLKILSDVVTDQVTYSNVDDKECLTEWMLYLVGGLCSNVIRYELLSCLSKIIQGKKREVVIREVSAKFVDILKNLANATIVGCDELVGKKLVINILFWCDNYVINSALDSGVLDEDGYPEAVRNYAKMIFNHKFRDFNTLLLSRKNV